MSKPTPPYRPLPSNQQRQGYGVKPTIHVLIRLIFTLSECSPMSGQQSQNGSPGGSAAPTAARGDSGLTGGTDALRLACLECLEVSSVLLRLPLHLYRRCVFVSACSEARCFCECTELVYVCGTASCRGVLFFMSLLVTAKDK